jgi:hypothetical protein
VCEQVKITWTQVKTVGGMGRNVPDILCIQKLNYSSHFTIGGMID